VTAVTVLIAPGVTAAMAGFALAFANSISHSLLFVVRRFVQLEQSMVALERIKEYSELPREAAEFVEPRPSASWPHNGGISVERLEIRYAVSVHLSPRQIITVADKTSSPSCPMYCTGFPSRSLRVKR
jgi:ABC-type multidrug transport system fused ATPase/permease subunit